LERKRRAGLAVAMGLFWSCFFCYDARGATPRLLTLHIEGQPLDGALLEFARQTGIQVLFFSRLAEGRRSPPLNGTYTLEAAMAALLSESDLKYRVINARTIEIIPAPPAAPGRRSGRLFGKVDAINCT